MFVLSVGIYSLMKKHFVSKNTQSDRIEIQVFQVLVALHYEGSMPRMGLEI